MAEPKTEDNYSERVRSLRVDITLLVVGLFLALGVQNMVQFVEAAFPHVSPYFYLTVGVGSLFMVLVFLGMAARIAGIDRMYRKK